jgi:methylase of polypeptide subunit release factors
MNGTKFAAGTSRDTSATASDPSSTAVSDPPLYDIEPAHRLIERHQKLSYPYFCTFGQANLEIDEGVFCPELTQTSPWLLELLTFRPAQRVLDVFAGSGAFGINAALHGARAILVDTSPAACACASKNSVLNHVDDKVTVRQGAVGDCLAHHETFDLIVANPPLLPGPQSEELHRAIFDPELGSTVNFIRQVGRHLNPQGSCYLLTSDVIERCGYDVDQLCAESDLYSSIVDKRDVGYETYRVHRLIHA